MKFKDAQLHQIYHLRVSFNEPFQAFNRSEALVYIWDNTLVLAYEFLSTTANIAIPNVIDVKKKKTYYSNGLNTLFPSIQNIGDNEITPVPDSNLPLYINHNLKTLNFDRLLKGTQPVQPKPTCFYLFKNTK
jgi:hypothetical protein